MQFGSYHIVRKLAQGGMAEIFLARHVSTEGFKRQVVIKRILPEFSDNPTFIESFLDEARLAGLLSHPNVAQIYDLGKVGSAYFIAMEYVRGVDLVALLVRARKRQEPIPLPVALRIFCDVCAGLDYAHNATDIDGKALGVVHRDVTPSNVLVSSDGPAKLVDFGIAKATARGDGKTKTGMIKGKFAYLAPEQISGQPIDRRVDVFAAGIVLHELLTNKNPFRRETEYQTLLTIMNDAPPAPSLLRPEAACFDAVVAKALAREPNERFQSARELLAAVEEAAFKGGIAPSHAAVSTFLETASADMRRANEEASDMKGVIFDATGSEPTGMSERGPGEVDVTRTDSVRAKIPVTKRTDLEAADDIELVPLDSTSLDAALEESLDESAPEPASSLEVRPTDQAASRRKPRNLVVVFAAVIVALGVGLGLTVFRSKPPPPQVVLTPAPVVAPVVAPVEKPVAAPIEKPAPIVIAAPPVVEKTKAAKKGKARGHEPSVTNVTPAPAAGATGRLKLLVKPWGVVRLDGRTLGETPFAPLEVTGGAHEIVITNPEIGKSVTKRITVQAGKDNVVSVDLEKE